MRRNTNRTLSVLLVLTLCLSMLLAMVASAEPAPELEEEYWWQYYMEYPEEDLTAPGVDANGQVTTTGGYVLLTSDTHSNEYLAADLLAYANQLVQEDTGDPDAYVSLFAFGGDFADSGLLPDVMTILKHAIVDTSPNTVATYTKGNHEGDFSDEDFLAITGMPRIGEVAVNTDGLYYFYNFGMIENQAFTQEDIDLLADYLANHNDGKPVFVISHFPIHYLNSMRSVYGSGAKELLDVLNQYPQVIFTWGHNHSEADPSYGTVRFPGETITYGPSLDDTVELKFTYCSNGSLRFGVNQENGVLVKVGEDGSLYFRFISLDQYAADDVTWEDSAGTEFETLVSGDIHVVSEVFRPALDDDYYKTINAAQVFINRPKVGETPSALEDVTNYDDRYTVTGLEWSTGGEVLEPGTNFDFNTAYTATVTITANDGYALAEDLVEQKNTAVNPVYHGPMTDEYTTGGDVVKLLDASTVVIEHTYDNTVESYDPPIEPATEIIEGHQYVMASIDETDVSVYYKYEYQEGARRQNYKPRVNDVVVIDGKLASKTEPFETYTAVKDADGFILWTDASLLDHGFEENSIETINMINVYNRRGDYELENGTGDIFMYNNWNVDENGLPYVNYDGVLVYPYTVGGMSLAGTTDPAECNLRLFDVGEAGTNFYIISVNVTAPVAGETPDPAATWTPADETFQPETEYTAVVDVLLTAPVTDAAAAIGRINGKDVDMTFSEDGLTATLTFTFPATNPEAVPAAATARKADAFEAGKTYMLVDADGIAITAMSTADGRFLKGAQVTVADDAITEGITEDMLFTVEASDTEGAFYVKGSRGYLIGRKETEDAFEAWGITFTDAPAMTIIYEDGKIYTKNNGVPNPFGFGGESDPAYFYLNDGHFNDAIFAEGDTFTLYEVEIAG